MASRHRLGRLGFGPNGGGRQYSLRERAVGVEDHCQRPQPRGSSDSEVDDRAPLAPWPAAARTIQRSLIEVARVHSPEGCRSLSVLTPGRGHYIPVGAHYYVPVLRRPCATFANLGG